MLVTTLFTIDKICNQLRSPLTDEWVKKNVYMKRRECYLAIKSEILSFATKWMVPEDIILNAKTHWKILDFPIYGR